MDGHRTPEEAARGDIPARFARLVAISEWNDYAYVVLELNEPPQVDIQVSTCERIDGLWHAGSSSGGHRGGGWSRIGETGVVSQSGTAPEGVASVRMRFRGGTIDCPVEHGYYLFTVWGVSSEEFDAVDLPVVVAFVMADGEVIDPPEDPDRVLAARRWLRERLEAFRADRSTKGNEISMTRISADEVPDFVRDHLRHLEGGGGAPEVGRPDGPGS